MQVRQTSNYFYIIVSAHSEKSLYPGYKVFRGSGDKVVVGGVREMQYTILAVDDEPANLRMLERLLRKDYRVLTANSGEEALTILQRESVDLILTDQRM